MKTTARADQRNFHIIYKTTCTVTGRWYIGLHSTDDLEDGYRGSGTRLQYSLKKYGKDAHTVEVLEFLPDRKSLVEREATIITEEMISDPMCMNLMKGGGRVIHSAILKEQSRIKISNVAKGMWARRKADPEKMAAYLAKMHNPEHIVKRAEALKAKGYKRSEEQLKNLRDGQAKYYSSADTALLCERGAKSAVTRQIRGNANGGRPVGIPMTDEQKAHLSARLKGVAKPAGLGDKVREGLKTYFSIVDREILKDRSRKGSKARSEALKKYHSSQSDKDKISWSEKLSLSHGKIWVIEAEDGSQFKINNFSKFCLSHGLNDKAVSKTQQNKKFVNGFRLVEKIETALKI